MKCYYNDLKTLRKKLTFQGLQDNLDHLTERLYSAMFDPKIIVTYSEIIEKLLAVKETLVKDYHSLYLGQLNELMDKVHIFKTNFATLDIREDHSKHHAAVEAILRKQGAIKKSLSELSQQELIEWLVKRDLTLPCQKIMKRSGPGTL